MRRNSKDREIVLRYDSETTQRELKDTKNTHPFEKEPATLESARRLYSGQITFLTQLGGDGRETPYYLRIGLKRNKEADSNRLACATMHVIEHFDGKPTIEKNFDDELLSRITKLTTHFRGLTTETPESITPYEYPEYFIHWPY